MSFFLELGHRCLPFTLQEGLEVAFDINNPVVKKAIMEKDPRIIEALKEVLNNQGWLLKMLDEQKTTAEFDEALKTVKKRWYEK